MKKEEIICFAWKYDKALHRKKCNALNTDAVTAIGDKCGTLGCPFWKPDADLVRIGDKFKRR